MKRLGLSPEEMKARRRELSRIRRAKNAQAHRDEVRAWKLKNPEKAREMYLNWYHRPGTKERLYFSFLKRKYGLTQDDWKAMFKAQKGKCAVCGTKDFSAERQGRPVLDHCHVSGLPRGLVCSLCNLMIGAAKESIDRLRGAIKYLKIHADKK